MVVFVLLCVVFVFFVLVLIDKTKNEISVALLIHQLLNTSETLVISMIRLLHEVDCNKYDKTFYSDYVADNVYYNRINQLKLNKYGYIRA